MSKLVQISLLYLELKNEPRYGRPVFETSLDENQQIIGFHNYWVKDQEDRKTVDHRANVWVATTL